MRDEGRLTFHHQWMLAVLTDVGDHPVLRPPRDEELWILVSCLLAGHRVTWNGLGLSSFICKK